MIGLSSSLGKPEQKTVIESGFGRHRGASWENRHEKRHRPPSQGPGFVERCDGRQVAAAVKAEVMKALLGAALSPCHAISIQTEQQPVVLADLDGQALSGLRQRLSSQQTDPRKVVCNLHVHRRCRRILMVDEETERSHGTISQHRRTTLAQVMLEKDSD